MSTHQGTLVADLYAHVDNAMELSKSRRRSSVDREKPKGWVILISARTHLCNHIMEPSDITAWWIMADLQDELLTEASKTCVIPVPTNSTGEEAVECGRPAVDDSGICEKHLDDFEGEA